LKTMKTVVEVEARGRAQIAGGAKAEKLDLLISSVADPGHGVPDPTF